MLSEKERQALDGITFHVTDDGGVDYRREDGNLLTPENRDAIEKFLFHMNAIEQSIVASGGCEDDPKVRRCMLLEMAADFCGLDGDKT